MRKRTRVGPIHIDSSWFHNPLWLLRLKVGFNENSYSFPRCKGNTTRKATHPTLGITGACWNTWQLYKSWSNCVCCIVLCHMCKLISWFYVLGVVGVIKNKTSNLSPWHGYLRRDFWKETQNNITITSLWDTQCWPYWSNMSSCPGRTSSDWIPRSWDRNQDLTQPWIADYSSHKPW